MSENENERKIEEFMQGDFSANAEKFRSELHSVLLAHLGDKDLPKIFAKALRNQLLKQITSVSPLFDLSQLFGDVHEIAQDIMMRTTSLVSVLEAKYGISPVTPEELIELVKKNSYPVYDELLEDVRIIAKNEPSSNVN